MKTSLLIAALISILLVRYLPQLFFDVRNSRKNSVASTKCKVSALWIMISYVSIYSASVYAIYFNGGAQGSFWKILGISFVVIGAAVGLTALWTIKDEYSEEIRIYQGGKLITQGIYGIIRHPLRLALDCELLGIIVLSQQWSLLLILFFIVVSQVLRTDEEDRFLRTYFGAEAEKYQKTIPSFNFICSMYNKFSQSNKADRLIQSQSFFIKRVR